MNENRYIVLLNDCLKRHMLGLEIREKRRLREKFEFLEAGIWDSGVRVKKLRGASRKVIFEARASKGERIIFTLGRYGNQTAIYVWAVVKHDHINSSIQNISPENAPFLNFEPDSSEERTDILIEDLPEEYFSQEAIGEKSPDDYGPQKWLVLSDEEWERMLLAGKPDDLGIFLFLTSEQSRILDRDPPLLLSGTAGSGKTTISVYYLLRKEFLNKRRLFLTYNSFLNEFSEGIYRGLVSHTDLEKSDMQPDFYVFRDLMHELTRGSGSAFDGKKEVGLKEFEQMFRNHRFYRKYDSELVWEEIRSIIKGAKPPIRLERYRKLIQAFIQNDLGQRGLYELKDYLLGLKKFEVLEKIERILARKSRYSRVDELVQAMTIGSDPARDEHKFILTEVLRIIEKRVRSFASPLLTYQEYLNLGRKRAPNFLFERKDVYAIAEYYQSQLEEQGKWDEIDLCRQAIQRLDHHTDRFTYDLVVCDEVQDFADIQLSLIFRLARTYGGLVFTGDPKQIVNPSGFRWEEVKEKFYERGVEVPDVHLLNLNFRCVGSIVKLSNALLDLKQQLIGLSSSELREEWKFNGRPPFLLAGIREKTLIERMHLTGTGQIILVRNRVDQRKLKKALATELVFTIGEAKGLEFDTVLIWKFSSEEKSANIWRRIKCGNFDTSHFPHIRHEINLLYVAITRARNTLIIFESGSDLWELPTLSHLIYRTSEEDILSEIWQRVSTPEEWDKQGDYFFERKYYPAAAECYKNAGNLGRVEIAQAHVFEERKRFKRGAELFEKHGLSEKAAECFESAGLFTRALPLWKKLGDRDRIELCTIRVYEENGEYDQAAEAWFKLKEFTRALDNWHKGGNYQKIGEYYYSKRQYQKAAGNFENAGNDEMAAKCYKKIRQFDKAADLLFRTGDYVNAMKIYKKLKNGQKLLSCYLNLRDYYNAGLLYEKGKDMDTAIACFRDFANASLQNKKTLLEEAKRYEPKRSRLKAAARYSALSMYDRSAPIFFEKKLFEKALEEFRTLKDRERAAECLLALNNYYQAALEYEKTDSEDKWLKVTDALVEHLNSYEGYRRAPEAKLTKEADALLEQGLYDRAIARYKAVDYSDRLYDAYRMLDRDEEAIDYFLTDDMYDANRYIDSKEDVTVSDDFLTALVSKWKESRQFYFRRRRDVEAAAKLLRLRLVEQRDEKIMDLTSEFLSSFPYLTSYQDLPYSVVELILEARHCNAILELLKSKRYLKDSSGEALNAFVKALDEKANQENDEDLLACTLFVQDRCKFEDMLDRLRVKELNYSLFAESKRHYQRAVDYLVEMKRVEDAARICRMHEDYGLSGKIYEEAGYVSQAAKDYREGGLYEEALRCYRQVGDVSGSARVYERMLEFDEAISIWKKLGKTREVNRVLKKKAKTLGEGQLKLF
jgi:tetratricopeptide (TPR) repeat protein